MRLLDLVVFGQPIFRCGSVDSTQNVAREKAQAGLPAGTVVTAQTMTAGRGRRGRAWHTPPGANVCLTAVCPTVDDTTALWPLAFVAGLAAIDAVCQTVPDARAVLRFPNDLMAANKKVSGVLVETTTVRGQIVPLIGVGINVLAAPRPPELAQRATSLQEAAGETFASCVADVETALFAQMTTRWHEWQTAGFAPLLADWKMRADFDLPRTFVFDGAPVMCLIADIGLDGMLTLRLPDETTRQLPAAQIVFGDD